MTFQVRDDVAPWVVALKRKLVVTGGLALATTVVVTVIALRPTHPLQQRRWKLLNPIGMCGTGPPTTEEFGRDGFVRSYQYFGGKPFSKDGRGDPLPYSLSGNRVLYGGPGGQELEYTITGKSMTMRVLGMAGTEWENYTYRYEAE